jgi:hypothetical protein
LAYLFLGKFLEEWTGKWWVKHEERIGKLGQAFKTGKQEKKSFLFSC